MKIKIVDTEDGFDGLEAAWNALADRTPSPFFSSFDYVRTAWSHFHGKEDRLCILVFSEADTVEGIAPFYIAHRHIRGIPCRVIMFIASWEGDRPRILTSRNEVETWNSMLSFLERDFTDWEILELMEQPVEGPTGAEWSFLFRSGWYWESEPDVVDYYISLGGSWDEYLSGLGKNTRRNWRKPTRRLSAAAGGYKVERISDPSDTREALNRFVTIEQSSWKVGTKIGVAKDERHQRFYEDLVIRLAGKGQVMFHFIKIGQEDAAGIVSFMCRDVIYPRHTAYLAAHAAYSPGILILAEIMREGFMGPWREVDLLGLKEDESSNKFKVHWATGKRETVHWTGYRLRSRLLPLIAAKRLKRILSMRRLCAAEIVGTSAVVASDSNND